MEMFDCQRAISESFSFTKSLNSKELELDKLYFYEFKSFLETLRQYFVYYEVRT